MKLWGSLTAAALLLAPSLAQAQKPSDNVHTRSADVYLGRAAEERVAADRKEIYEKALEAALKGVAADPDNPKPWYQAGVAYAGMADYVGADSTLDRAEQMYPEYVEQTERIRQTGWISLYNSAVAAVQAGDAAAAKAALETADRLYRERPEALVTLGSLYAQENNAAKAEESYKAALEIIRGPAREGLNPEQLKSWAEDELSTAIRLANLYAAQNRNDDAATVYRELLTTQPDNAMAKANLAVVLSRAGKTEEATAVYNELLERDDLTEATLFNTGIGLFRAGQFERSALAFRRTAELGPYVHDTLYNLANALFAVGVELEKEAETAAAPRKAEIATQLGAVHEELLAIATRLHELDPTNRNVLMMLAQAQRSLGERAGATPEGDEWRKKALATLEMHKALPFEVSDIVVVPSETEIQVMGRLTNLNAPEGAPIKLQFVVLGRDGSELATQDIDLTAPATSESTRIEATVTTPEGAAAWKYRVIR